jgi:hypothetical protein
MTAWLHLPCSISALPIRPSWIMVLCQKMSTLKLLLAPLTDSHPPTPRSASRRAGRSCAAVQKPPKEAL